MPEQFPVTTATAGGATIDETKLPAAQAAHSVPIGGGTVATPSATSGVPLVSAGASADPTFGTAAVAGGGTGVATIPAHAVVLGEGTSPVASAAPSATVGQPLLSQGASADPAFAALDYAGLAADVHGAFSTRAGAGAIDIVSRLTKMTSAAVGASMTLVDGVAGQRKSLVLTALTTPGSHTAIVAPTHGGPLTFDTVGDSMELEFDGTNWVVVSDCRATTRPPSPRILTGQGHNNVGACTLVGAKVGDKVVSVQDITLHILTSANFEAVITVADQIQQTGAGNLSASTILVYLRPLS